MHSTQVAVNSFDEMHHLICRDYSATQFNTSDPSGPIDARLAFWRFGLLGFGAIDFHGSQTMHSWRGPEEIRRDPREEYLLFMIEEGEAAFEQLGHHCRIRAGDMVIWDQSLPFQLSCGPVLRSRCVSIPYAELRTRGDHIERITARAVRGGNRMGALAGSVVRQMIALGDADGWVTDLTDGALDILTAALQRELFGNPRPPHRQSGMLGRVKHYLLANLHDGDLDVKRIAVANDMGPRTMHRLFANEGTTVIRWLWEQRLAASYRDLTSGGGDRVTTVGFRYGFNDSAHFSRAFKKAYGRSPQEVRNDNR